MKKNRFSHLTESECIEFVTNDPQRFKELTVRQQTNDVCEALIWSNPYLFNHIAEYKRTASLCLTAINTCGMLLCDIPDKHMSEELCLAAVRETLGAIEQVPPKYLTRRVGILVLLLLIDDKLTSDLVIEKHVTSILNRYPKLMRLAPKLLATNGGWLLHIPKKFRTAELIDLGLDNNPHVIINLPVKDRTQKRLRKVALNGDWHLIGFYTAKEQTFAVCKAYFESAQQPLITHIRKKARTEKVRIMAVKNYSGAILDMEPDDRTEAVWLTVFKATWFAEDPGRYLTAELLPTTAMTPAIQYTLMKTPAWYAIWKVHAAYNEAESAGVHCGPTERYLVSSGIIHTVRANIQTEKMTELYKEALKESEAFNRNALGTDPTADATYNQLVGIYNSYPKDQHSFIKLLLELSANIMDHEDKDND